MTCMSVGLLVAAAVGVAGCEPANERARVRVTYEQVANFADYRLAPDSTRSHGAGPDGLFVMYRIKKIENTGPEAQPFVFDTHEIALVTDSATVAEETIADDILLAGQLASPLEVPAGRTATRPQGLGCIIKVARHAEPKLIVGKMIDPVHPLDAEQPVTMARLPGNDREIAVTNALPNTLQDLCDTQ